MHQMTLRSNSSPAPSGKKKHVLPGSRYKCHGSNGSDERVFQRNPLRNVAVHFSKVALPFSACGLVIGKGGAVQREIREKTGRCRRTWWKVEGSQERWPVAHLKSMVLAISSLDYIEMKRLFYLIRGLGPRRKVMPVATKMVRGWHSSWVNIKFAVIHDWFEGHDVRQPVSTRNDHSFNVHWAWYGWKGHWLLALWAHENPPGIHVQITPKGNNVVHNERALSKKMTPSALVIIMASDSRNFIICSAFLKRLMPFRETPRSADT